MPVVNSTFKPAWWLPNTHLQTLWSTFFRRRPILNFTSFRLTLDDGDFIDVSTPQQDTKEPTSKPIVLILHGLEGSLSSPYATPLINALQEAGYSVYFMHFRGCSHEPNTLPRSYHSGATDDVQSVVHYLIKKHQRKLHAVIGFSLGGNVLLKWLGEQQHHAATHTAIAISVPFQLADAAKRMNQGFSKIYQRHLISRLKQKYTHKFKTIPSPLQVNVKTLHTFYDFDHHITAPLHGFNSGNDYYQQCSSRQFINTIKKPTLILHALDDPFMYPTTAPTADELPKNVQLELSKKGGHVGFISGNLPWKAHYWIDERIIDWLNNTSPK